MLEREIEEKVVNYAKKRKFRADKNKTRSLPDRTFISPTGNIFYVEFKRKGKSPTKLQQITINDLLSRSVKVFIIDDLEQGKLLINEYI